MSLVLAVLAALAAFWWGYPYIFPSGLTTINASLEFSLVADLDLASRDPEQFLWKSYLLNGSLTVLENGNYSLTWHKRIRLYGETARKNRSMELSDLAFFKGRMFAFCDYTGIMYRIEPTTGMCYQRHALADGPGARMKPFKTEWATVKDDQIVVGSIGMEWINPDGEILHYDAQWVKLYSRMGAISNLDWTQCYEAVRAAANASAPGYLLHEAVVWSPSRQRWYFFPRRRSFQLYNPISDERQGTNLMISADAKFQNLKVTEIGPQEDEWGFSSAKEIPDTHDFILLKVREVDGETATRVLIYDEHGRSKLEGGPLDINGTVKYEGIAFYR